MLFLLILLANITFSSATILNEFGKENSILYRRWPLTLLIMVGLITSNWLVIRNALASGLENGNFGFVSPLLFSVLCVASMTPYLIFGTVNIIANALKGFMGLRNGPKKFPQVLALMEKGHLDRAQGLLYALETKYPRNLEIKRLLVKSYLLSGKSSQALGKIKTLINLVEKEEDREELLELANSIDPYEASLIRLRWFR